MEIENEPQIVSEKRRVLEVIVGGKVRRRLDLIVNGSVILLRNGKPPARFDMNYEIFQKKLYEIAERRYHGKKVEIREFPNHKSYSPQ